MTETRSGSVAERADTKSRFGKTLGVLRDDLVMLGRTVDRMLKAFKAEQAKKGDNPFHHLSHEFEYKAEYFKEQKAKLENIVQKLEVGETELAKEYFLQRVVFNLQEVKKLESSEQIRNPYEKTLREQLDMRRRILADSIYITGASWK